MSRIYQRPDLENTYLAPFTDTLALALGLVGSVINRYASIPVRCIARHLFPKEWQDLKERVSEIARYLENNSASIAPITAQKLLISGEDHRFFEHGGFDVLAMTRAVWMRLRFGRKEGASTIEQQLVRVLTRRFERRLSRKAREIFLASLVSAEFGKKHLPAIYLHVGYYGWNLHDFQSACQAIDARGGSNLYALAEIVARLKYPEPRYGSVLRKKQITLRAQHLISLFKIHSINGAYGPLSYAWIPDRRRTLAANRQTSGTGGS